MYVWKAKIDLLVIFLASGDAIIFFSFTHQYLLNEYCAPGPVLVSGDKVVNKTKSLPSQSLQLKENKYSQATSICKNKYVQDDNNDKRTTQEQLSIQ